MNKSYTLLFIAFTMVILQHSSMALEHLNIPVGIQMQANSDLQWGLTAGLSTDLLLKGHPYTAVSYTTNRIGAVFSNTVKQDNYLFTLGWMFRPKKMIDPFINIDAGLAHFDYEFEEFKALQTNSPILDLRFGLEGAFLHKTIHPWCNFGVSFISSSTVYPLVMAVGVNYDISKGLLK
jgi:hypothetical protein